MSKAKLSKLKLKAENANRANEHRASDKKQSYISYFFESPSSEKRNFDKITQRDECEGTSKRQCIDSDSAKGPSTSAASDFASKLQQFEIKSGNVGDKAGQNKSEVDCEMSQGIKFEDCSPAIHPCTGKTESSGSHVKVQSKTGVKVKYTPLELQFIEIKDKNPNCLLFVECGYKYRFFGEDAEIAAKELNIFCHLDHNFMTASVPTHRLHVHISRLVSKGYKVGIVRQTETAALKAAGDNKGAPFTRKLTNIYTIGTFVDGSLECDDPDAFNTGGHLLCVYENMKTSGEKLQSISVLSVDLATGNVIYDHFMDNSSRFELESRLKHIQPIEVLLPMSVSSFTQNMLKTFKTDSCDSIARTEYLDDSLFYGNSPSDYIRRSYEKLGASAETVKEVLQLDKNVLVCLQAMLSYLEEFNLTKVLSLNTSFKPFTDKEIHMQLCGRTLDNLEVFVNSVDGKVVGSLYWLLNQTVTAFGGRLLKHWLGQPLMDLNKITLRQEAIGEIIEESDLDKLRLVLKGLPDLERGLTLIFHGKCSPQEFLLVCQSLSRVQSCMNSLNISVKSTLMQNIVKELPKQLADIEHWVKSLNPKAAKEGSKKDLFTQESDYPSLAEVKQRIQDILTEIQSHRREVRLTLKAPALDYTTVLGTEFLVEVKNSNLGLVPNDWMKISSTKSVTRYHTPFVMEAYKRLSQQRERLEAVCEQAWIHFLRSFEAKYPAYKAAVHSLAVLDCLFSLAQVAKEQDYCRPELTEESGILEVKQGRHPVVNVLLSQGSQQFVPNDTNMQPKGEQCMLITGPNMGGKSSYIKQVALICIMAQMGSFVPAESARLSILDAVHTRMGASDDLYKGRSTFMVELCEAAEVLEKASSRSLVIMDELGRGTSTHDGVAIAYATLRHFVEKAKCLTMFVTHYPPLVEVEQMHPGIVANYHMSFYVQDSEDKDSDVESLVFLYQLVRGIAQRSYGLNVARLAGMPETLLKEASARSKMMEDQVTQKRLADNLFRKLFSEEVTEDTKQDLLKYS